MAGERGAALLGLFEAPDAVARALDALRERGVAERDLTVLSGSPYPEGAFGEREEKHHLYVYPFIGAACGFVIGLLLTIATQLSYPLVTGGKPILSVPPMLNVMYEGTLLGALIAIVLGTIFESRLPYLGDAPYDPRISEGYLGVLVTDVGQHEDRVRAALRAAGALETIGGSEQGVAR